MAKHEKLDALRAEIDAIDRQILDQIDRRMQKVAEIALIKRELGLAAYQPERFAQMLDDRRRYVEGLRISPDTLEALLTLLQKEALILQGTLANDDSS